MDALLSAQLWKATKRFSLTLQKQETALHRYIAKTSIHVTSRHYLFRVNRVPVFQTRGACFLRACVRLVSDSSQFPSAGLGVWRPCFRKTEVFGVLTAVRRCLEILGYLGLFGERSECQLYFRVYVERIILLRSVHGVFSSQASAAGAGEHARGE